MIDLLRGNQQQMWIMNLVWPICALFGTVLTLWLYFSYGRLATRRNMQQAREQGVELASKRLTPFSIKVAKSTAHCGSGCTLGDICAEFLALAFPVVATWVGWKWLFPPSETGKMFAIWVLDYVFALVIGVAFQYFTIVPMRNLTFGRGLVEAFKADLLSLTSWQVGMYGCMAVAQLVVFAHIWPAKVTPARPEFWFAMQIAMLCGFVTAYPVNWWLIRQGIKEAM